MSLVEVLIAVAICAGAVIAALALFGPAVRGPREGADRRTAAQLADPVVTELQRLGHEAVLAATNGGETLELVADGEGMRVVRLAVADNDPASGTPPGLAAGRRYYRIEVRRALRPPADAGCVVVEVRVSWPLALPPEGGAVPEAERSHFVFHAAVNR